MPVKSDTMTREYRISLGMKIVYTALALFLAIMPFIALSGAKLHSIQPMLISLLILWPLAALLVYGTFRRKILIDDHSIRYTGAFSRREIAFSDIRGFRILSGKSPSLRIISAADNTPGINIPAYTDFSGKPGFDSFIRERFEDLDKTDREKEEKEFLDNDQWGSTSTKRRTILENARKVAIAYNIIGFLIIPVAFLADNRWAFVIPLAYPIIGLGILWIGKGLLRFYSDRRSSVLPFIMPGFLPSCFVLPLVSISNYHLLGTSHLWLPSILLSLVVFFLIYKADIQTASAKLATQIIIMVFVAMPYGLGSILQLNRAGDSTHYHVYDATVLHQTFSLGKTTSYYITISPWGTEKDTKEIRIDKSFYRTLYVGDTIEVEFHEGLLHIPWYRVGPVITYINAPL